MHLHQHIPRVHLAWRNLALSTFDLYLIFHRYNHAKDIFLHVHGFHALFQVRLHFVFISGLSVDHIPFFIHTNAKKASSHLYEQPDTAG